MESTKQLKCPKCCSRVVRAGWEIVNKSGKKRQIYLCKSCRTRTLNPVF